MKSRREALATYLGMDSDELKDCRYHYGRTSKPIWAVGGSYYCVTKGSESPAKHRDGMEFNWMAIDDVYISNYGYSVWESTSYQ